VPAQLVASRVVLSSTVLVCGDELSGSRTGRFSPGERAHPRYPFDNRLGAPKGRHRHCRETEMSHICQETDWGRPACSQSLYTLSYISIGLSPPRRTESLPTQRISQRFMEPNILLLCPSFQPISSIHIISI
jgi:hypothetical protein